MAGPALSQVSLVQVPKHSLLTPKTKTLFTQNPCLFPQHNHNQLSLKIRNGFVPKASMAAVPVQSNIFPAKKSDNPIIVIDNYDSFTYNLCQVCPKFISLIVFLIMCLWMKFFAVWLPRKCGKRSFFDLYSFLLCLDNVGYMCLV